MAPRAEYPEDWQLQCGELKQRGAHLLKSKLWSDCSFLVGEQPVEIVAHKLILAMASPVFEAMFYGPIAEGDNTITIPDIHPEIFESLLKYIYTDNIELDSFDKACSLYYGAQKYMLTHLLTVCTMYMSCNLTPEVACQMYEFALLVGEENLVTKCEQMIKSNTSSILFLKGFEEASLETVEKIFSMNNLNISSELDLFKAAERYFKVPTETMGENESRPNEIAKDDDDAARSEATFRFTIHNISQLNEQVLSPPCFIRCLPWKILVLKRKGRRTQTLGVYIECNGDDESDWSCHGSCELKLLSHKSDEGHLCRKLEHLYSCKEDDWGFAQFISFKSLMNPDNGFVKDDAITIEAHVVAEAPHGVSWDSKIHRGFDDFVKTEDKNKENNIDETNKDQDSQDGSNSDPVPDGKAMDEDEKPADHTDCLPTISSSKKQNQDVDIKNIKKLVQQIRFLTLTPKELAEYPTLTSLLTESEILALLMNTVSANTRMPMPEGFSLSRTKR